MRVMLDEGVTCPTRAHEDDAGLDLYTQEGGWVPANGRRTFDTGVHVEIPKGYVGLLTSKSGLMSKGITTRGTVDSGYTGSIKAVVFNHNAFEKYIDPHVKITQLVIVPCLTPPIEYVDRLDETERGDKGFGSTGR